MASRTPGLFLRSFKGRLYGTAAAAAESSEAASLVKQPARVTKLDNGLTVASIENCSPLSQVAVLVNAGSRFESRQDVGVAHFLRTATGLTTKNMSDISLVKTVEQAGASLGCTGTREYLIYNVEALRNEVFSTPMDALNEILVNPDFRNWELQYGFIRNHMRVQLSDLREQPQVRLMEMVHEAAFRDQLGRSLFAQPHRIDGFNQEQLLAYHNKYFTLDRMALVGVGVNHQDLIAEGKSFNLKKSQNVTTEKSIYHGGEIRSNTTDEMTHATVVTEGPSLRSKDLFPVCVLQQIMGTGPFVKYGDNSVSRLGKAIAAAIPDQAFGTSCVSANYTDGGLFGFYLCAAPGDMEKGLRAAMSAFANVTKSGVTDEEVTRGKNLLKSAIAMNLEQGENVLQDLAEQAFGSEKIYSTEDLIKAVDAVQTSDVSNVAKKIINGKASMAALGDLQNVPYLDELTK